MAVMAVEVPGSDVRVEGPREKLQQILAKNGEAVLENPDKVEGLLRDHCGAYRKEISALVGALNERVPLELKGSWQAAMTPEAMRARLVQRMQEHRGLAPEIAEWAVETWSFALHVDLGRRSELKSKLHVISAPAAVRAQTVAEGGWEAVPVAGQATTAGEAERLAAIASDRPGGFAAASRAWLENPQQRKKLGIRALILLVVVAAFAMNRPKPIPTPIADVNPPAQPAKPVAHAQPVAKPKPTPAVVAAVAPGTPLEIRMLQGFRSDQVAVGQTFSGLLEAPLVANGKTVVPAGSNATVEVVSVDPAGKVTGQSQMELALVGLNAGGKVLRVTTSDCVVSGAQQGKTTLKRGAIGGGIGAGAGALIGALAHHPGSGAAAGGMAGAATGIFTGKRQPAMVTPNNVVSFRLVRPLAV